MRIHFPEPPAKFQECIREGLTEGARIFRNHKTDHVIGSEFSPAMTEMPLEIYSIAISALKSDTDISDAISDGWCVFLGQGPPVQIAEALRADGGTGAIFHGISSGPQIDAIRSVLEKLRNAPQGKEMELTARLLRVKPVHATAIWLATPDWKNDILIAIPPAFTPLEAGMEYSATEYSELLKQAARARAASARILFAK